MSAPTPDHDNERARHGDDHNNTTEARAALLHRLDRVLGYVPVGTLDLLNVLAHPDVIDDTRRFIESRGVSS